jgi:hypothetical protein
MSQDVSRRGFAGLTAEDGLARVGRRRRRRAAGPPRGGGSTGTIRILLAAKLAPERSTRLPRGRNVEIVVPRDERETVAGAGRPR